MERGRRIPLHDHSDRNSGGLVRASTILTVAPGAVTGTGSVVASDVAVADLAANFTGSDVEAVLAELQDNIDAVSGVTAAAVSALGFVGPLLISDTPSTPLVFADLIQNEAEDDLVYADL